MKFQLIVWVCLIFSTHTILRTKKASNNTMKKCYSRYCAGPACTGCAQQTFTVQNKPAAVAPKETITHHFFVSGWAEEKNCRCNKICGGAENVVKTETANIRKWIARFYYFRHLYSAGSACVLLTIIA